MNLTARMKLIIALTSVLLSPFGMLAADSIKTLEDAMKGLAPGTTVLLADGDYQTVHAIRIEGKHGTAEAPIVIRAEHRGKAVIGGTAGFVVRDCENLVLEGFVFTNDADQPAVLLDNCRHVQVTRNVFHLNERAAPRHFEHWVYAIGERSASNRIDHNLFEQKKNKGSPAFVRGDDDALVCSQHDRIDHNHFRDIIFANGQNGHETIRTGGNDLGASGKSSFTIIEDNLLERCSGEDEIISLKSSDNIVRNNTLLNCRGAIDLRLGNRDVVCGNFIIATDGQKGEGGVKLFGYDHRVFNNYFQGLTGTRHESPLGLIPGTLDTPTTKDIGEKYDDMTSVAPTRCWIAFNTWIDCSPLQFGFKKDSPMDKQRTCIPNECVFVNNLVVRTKPKSSPLVNLEQVRNLQAHDNLAYVAGSVLPDTLTGWFRYEEPRLHRAEDNSELWRLTESSPAIDAAVKVSATIDDDVFGHARIGLRDIGAEEFSKVAASKNPLTPDAVGPDAP